MKILKLHLPQKLFPVSIWRCTSSSTFHWLNQDNNVVQLVTLYIFLPEELWKRNWCTQGLMPNFAFMVVNRCTRNRVKSDRKTNIKVNMLFFHIYIPVCMYVWYNPLSHTHMRPSKYIGQCQLNKQNELMTYSMGVFFLGIDDPVRMLREL